MDKKLNKKRILIYLAFAFGIAWVAELVTSQTSLMKTNPTQAMYLVNIAIVIWAPVLANVATRLITREGWGNLMLRPNFRRSWRFYMAAWLLPFLAVIVGSGIFYLLFPQSFDPDLGELRKLYASIPGAAAINPWILLLSLLPSLMIITVLLNTVLSLGQALAGRAYLLPKLVQQFTGVEHSGASAEKSASAGGVNEGARKASLLIGLIHGVWHWPFFIMQMTYDPGMTFLALPVYLVFTCTLSVLMSWVTLHSGSVWPAAIVHGDIRPSSALSMYLLKGPAIPLIGPDPGGLIAGLGYIMLALVLLFSRRAFVGGKERGLEKAPVVTGRISA